MCNLMQKEVFLEAVAGCYVSAARAGKSDAFLKNISSKRRYLLRTSEEKISYEDMLSWLQNIEAEILVS